jgi:hypothetical protein
LFTTPVIYLGFDRLGGALRRRFNGGPAVTEGSSR